MIELKINFEEWSIDLLCTVYLMHYSQLLGSVIGSAEDPNPENGEANKLVIEFYTEMVRIFKGELVKKADNYFLNIELPKEEKGIAERMAKLSSKFTMNEFLEKISANFKDDFQ